MIPPEFAAERAAGAEERLVEIVPPSAPQWDDEKEQRARNEAEKAFLQVYGLLVLLGFCILMSIIGGG